MSIDHFYTMIDGKWVRFNMRVVDGVWRYMPDDELPDFSTDFWVDISHGGNSLTDERYYCADLASAIDFYMEGWKKRQYLDDDGKAMGLDHAGLYLRGCLVHGAILLDSHGHRSENLRQICEEIAKEMEADKRVCRGPETF